MKLIRPEDVLENKDVIVYKESSEMLKPSKEDGKKQQGTVVPINPNTRIIKKGV